MAGRELWLMGHTQITELTQGECQNAVTGEQDDRAYAGGGTQLIYTGTNDKQDIYVQITKVGNN